MTIPYKARLAALGLTQTSILPEIRSKIGLPVNNTELSAAITGSGKQKKHERILVALDEVLDDYENNNENCNMSNEKWG